MKDMEDPKLRSGKLRHTVTIQSFVITGLGQRGQPQGAWQTLYTDVPAEVVPLSGRQMEISRQTCATASHEITIRHHAGVLPQMRVSFRGRLFHIEYITEGDMRLHYMVLTTTEQQTGATN